MSRSTARNLLRASLTGLGLAVVVLLALSPVVGATLLITGRVIGHEGLMLTGLAVVVVGVAVWATALVMR